MSKAALQRHLKSLRQDGTLLIDSELIIETPKHPGKTFKIPANLTSQEKLGSPLHANVVMLGVLTEITKAVTAEAVEKAIADYLPSQDLEKNLKAFRLGLTFSAKPSAL